MLPNRRRRTRRAVPTRRRPAARPDHATRQDQDSPETAHGRLDLEKFARDWVRWTGKRKQQDG